MRAEPTNVITLLKGGNIKRFQYYIPPFQRDYSWKKAEWEQLWDDIINSDVNNSDGYYLGTIITIEESNGDARYGLNRYQVIDGQQRLTTLSLLLLAVFSHITENEQLFNIVSNQMRAAQLYMELLEEIVIFNTVDGADEESYIVEKPKLELQMGDSNNFYQNLVYSTLIKNDHIRTAPFDSTFDKRKRLYSAFKYFQERLKTLTDFGQIKALVTNINASKVINICVNNPNQAFEIFDTVNNRGVPLSASDLIKNSMLQMASQKSRLVATICLDEWNKMLKHLGDEPKDHERFLRHYYCLYKDLYRTGNRAELPKMVKKSDLIIRYNDWMKDNPVELMKDIANASEIYQHLISDDWVKLLSCDAFLYPYRNELRRFIHVRGSVGNILLLYILKERNRLNLKQNEIVSIIQMVTSFFLWRNLTGKPASNKLDDLFIRIVDGIKENPNRPIVKYVHCELAKSLMPNEDLKEVLNGNLYSENEDMVRFILCTLLEINQSADDKTDYWEKESNAAKAKYSFSIEHILPEGSPLPDVWVQEIAQGDRQKALLLQEEYCHKIGNLTLTIMPNNASLSNKSFLEKRDLTDRKNNNIPIGYRNGKWLNGDLGLIPDEKWTQSRIKSITISQTDTWTIQQIIDRTEALVQIIYHLFSMDSSEQ